MAECEILSVIADLCDQENIPWFLDSGTALGAMRHNGFIPWDDDIDIGMFRDDYVHFLEVAEQRLPQGYSIHTTENTKNYACHWAKVYKDDTKFVTQETLDGKIDMGIFIDVVPYDALASEGPDRKQQVSIALRNTRLLYLYYSKHIVVPHRGILGKLERFSCFLGHYLVRLLYSPEKITNSFKRAIEMGKLSDQVHAQYLCLAYPYVAPLERDDVFPTTMAQFEGRQFPVPGKTDRYLTKLYGNWRQLPPEEDRRTHMPLQLVFSAEESNEEDEDIIHGKR